MNSSTTTRYLPGISYPIFAWHHCVASSPLRIAKSTIRKVTQMNNPKSTVLGWASLIAAAGVSYYFAKKGINERRAEQDAAGTRPTEKLDWRQKIERDSQTQAQAAGGTSPGITDQAQALQISVSTDEKHGEVG